jgi:hypothetical protein
MAYSGKITEKSDSLIELLTAQCSDLEKLLALAREETIATQCGNFEDVFDIVTKRTEIGDRLETFQRQLSELRAHLGDSATTILNNEITARVVEVAGLTLAQDQKTRLLLTGVRESAAAELANLERGQRGANVYMRAETRGLSYNQSF